MNCSELQSSDPRLHLLPPLHTVTSPIGRSLYRILSWMDFFGAVVFLDGHLQDFPLRVSLGLRPPEMRLARGPTTPSTHPPTPPVLDGFPLGEMVVPPKFSLQEHPWILRSAGCALQEAQQQPHSNDQTLPMKGGHRQQRSRQGGTELSSKQTRRANKQGSRFKTPKRAPSRGLTKPLPQGKTEPSSRQTRGEPQSQGKSLQDTPPAQDSSQTCSKPRP